MKISIDVPDYDTNTGLIDYWENNFSIRTAYTGDEFLLQANKEGLVSLAIQLLALAQDNVPAGVHFHYDSYGSLEDGSVNFVIDKIK